MSARPIPCTLFSGLYLGSCQVLWRRSQAKKMPAAAARAGRRSGSCCGTWRARQAERFLCRGRRSRPRIRRRRKRLLLERRGGKMWRLKAQSGGDAEATVAADEGNGGGRLRIASLGMACYWYRVASPFCLS